ncbi:citrate synthase [Tsukamurella soli]|uniref:citrate synthase (unknown stereospecificity) n=1 Tax=Tsukamurella soli TaxID=644556 RepID=A0ABP8JL67_9ACTN
MDQWITTSEAARRLGVKRGTLYSYVSRGVLTSVRRPGQQESLFDRTQVDSLAAVKHDGRRAGERLLRFRSVATRVSAVRDDRLYLRGRDIETVCATMSFGEAARLTLQYDGAVPPAPALDAARIRTVPLERRIPLAVAEIAARDPCRGERAEVEARVLALLPALATVVPEVPLAHPWVDLLATCLIDNGLAASTTAARVAASARAGVYDALLSGLGAMAGHLHGGAPVRAARLLGAVAASHGGGAAVDAAIAEAVSVGGRLHGFGHLIYTGDDPRATVVLDRIRADDPGSPALEAVAALVDRVHQPVNVDLAGAVVAVALGLPAHATEVVFQYARIVGMAAHVVEEYDETPLRWRARGEG